MIVAIMQPYFFPYVGYFQLMRAADIFVFHDDAQYIKGGWINRNKIMINNHVDWLTMPVINASNYLPINLRYFVCDSRIVDRIKRRLIAAYSKMPSFNDVSPIIFELLDCTNTNVADFNCGSLIAVARRLGINCEFVRSSELSPTHLNGQEKVIELCHRHKADHYINPIGGLELYDPKLFAKAGIKLSFMETKVTPTPTESSPQHLSVIDGLMHFGFNRYSDLLSEYTLRDKGDIRVPQ